MYRGTYRFKIALFGFIENVGMEKQYPKLLHYSWGLHRDYYRKPFLHSLQLFLFFFSLSLSLFFSFIGPSLLFKVYRLYTNKLSCRLRKGLRKVSLSLHCYLGSNVWNLEHLFCITDLLRKFLRTRVPLLNASCLNRT